jgi:hypothetical protein
MTCRQPDALGILQLQFIERESGRKGAAQAGEMHHAAGQLNRQPFDVPAAGIGIAAYPNGAHQREAEEKNTSQHPERNSSRPAHQKD